MQLPVGSLLHRPAAPDFRNVWLGVWGLGIWGLGVQGFRCFAGSAFRIWGGLGAAKSVQTPRSVSCAGTVGSEAILGTTSKGTIQVFGLGVVLGLSGCGV